MSADTQVVMKIPPEIVQASVKAAVVQALGKDPEALVRAVVDAAMHEKTNSYDRTTIWDSKVNAAIRDVAAEAFKEWLDEQRPMIRAAVRARLGESRTKLVDDFASKLVDGLISTIGVSFHFRER
jgi:hypothetical protein